MEIKKVRKARKKLGRGLLSRSFFFAVLLLLQITLVVGIAVELGRFFPYFYLFLMLLSALAVLTLLDKDKVNPVYKIMWLILILVMPPTGTLFYLFWGHRNTGNRHAKRLETISERGTKSLTQDPEPMRRLQVKDKNLARSATYLSQCAGAPLYGDTQSEYYAWGQDFFPRFLEELKGAKHFIFMEYFIIKPGYMWDTTLEILTQKAAEGVDVRLLFDAFGCMFTLPENYDEFLRRKGIKCYPFAPPRLSGRISDYTMLNHRDHRKITVIDGNVGFTGGLNFSDEYFVFLSL